MDASTGADDNLKAKPTLAAARGSVSVEAAVRKMRDRVYGLPISDKEWESSKVHWLKPEETEWLRAQCAKDTERPN